MKKLLVLLTLLLLVQCSAIANEYQDVGVPISTIYTPKEHNQAVQVWYAEQLSNGNMLFAGTNGLALFDGANWRFAATPNNNRIRHFSVGQQQKIYTGTFEQIGWFEIDNLGELNFSQIDTSAMNAPMGEIWSVNSNAHQVIYSATQQLLSWNGKELKKVKGVKGAYLRVFNLDDQLIYCDRKLAECYRISNDSQPEAISLGWKIPQNAHIVALFRTQKGEIIALARNQGLLMLQQNRFEPIKNASSLLNKNLLSITQSPDGYYYATSTTKGLFILNHNFQLVRIFTQQDGIGSNTLYSVTLDAQNNVWLMGAPTIAVFPEPHLMSEFSTDDNTKDVETLLNLNGDIYLTGTGIYQLTNISSLSAPRFKKVENFEQVVWDMEEVDSQVLASSETAVFAFEKSAQGLQDPKPILQGRYFVDLVKHPNKNLVYAAADEGLFRLEKTNDQWHSVLVQGLNSQIGYVDLHPNNTDSLWASSHSQTLFNIESINALGVAESITLYDNDKYGLGNDHIVPFAMDTGMFIGTENGLLTVDEKASPPFKFEQWLPQQLNTESKNVFLLDQDEKGRIWYQAGVDTGLAYKNSEGKWQANETQFAPFVTQGTRGIFYHQNAVWFANTGGTIYRFSEHAFTTTSPVANVNIGYAKDINSQKLFSIGNKQILNPIARTENSLRIGFSLPDYTVPSANQFRTRLIGGENDYWTPWSSETHKDFPLLYGGSYVLEIEAKDPWQRESRTSLSFAIPHPWYFSVWAWLSYFFVAITLIIVSVIYGRRMRIKHLQTINQQLEAAVNERTRQLTEQQAAKDRFFANVAHEFRTPLTLINEPLKLLAEQHTKDLSSTGKQLIDTAKFNANKMLSLVGEVLDINRLEAGKMPLRVAKYELQPMLENNVRNFQPWAQQHGQQIEFISSPQVGSVYFDHEKIDKCVANLLSNAIKYSGDNSHITVSTVATAERVGIKVSDNGVGITEYEQTHIFERFFQTAGSESISSPGTGIGLALVKEIMQLHQGSIDLTASTNQGCQFTLWLKTGHVHFLPQQLVEPISVEPQQNIKPILTNNEEVDSGRTTVLIIDDNEELRHFISMRFQGLYRTLLAKDGIEGYQKTLAELPDLVISDVNMPNMNGLTLTKKIKSTLETQEIPVILLTAKSTKAETVAGLDAGADDYVVKPFDSAELLMRVNAIIKSRKLIRQQAIAKALLKDKTALPVNDFVEKLNKLILENISDPEYSVESLAADMFVSRETLARNCKKHLQMSPLTYMRKLRMDKAELLLLEQQLKISEVAYYLGYESLSYFTKLFKKHTGVTPSIFIAQSQNKSGLTESG